MYWEDVYIQNDIMWLEKKRKSELKHTWYFYIGAFCDVIGGNRVVSVAVACQWADSALSPILTITYQIVYT